MIISLQKERLRRKPVSYVVEFHHDHSGCRMETYGIEDSKEDRIRLAGVLEAAAKSLRDEWGESK